MRGFLTAAHRAVVPRGPRPLLSVRALRLPPRGEAKHLQTQAFCFKLANQTFPFLSLQRYKGPAPGRQVTWPPGRRAGAEQPTRDTGSPGWRGLSATQHGRGASAATAIKAERIAAPAVSRSPSPLPFKHPEGQGGRQAVCLCGVQLTGQH